MKSPVWFVLAKIDLVSGSTGFHRAYLIDRAVATFSQWWMLGTRTTAIFGEQIHGDITNEYVWQGINGGILTLILFILIIVNCFRGIGRIEARADVPLPMRRCAWAMGAALFAHVITFLSISYFDQNFVNWYLLLALIATSAGMSFGQLPPKLVTKPGRQTPAGISSTTSDGAAVCSVKI